MYAWSYTEHGFSIAKTALLLPVVVVALALTDVFDSREQPDMFDDPLVGQSVTAIEPFRAINDSFEGRVMLNGATWNARCLERQLDVGEEAEVCVRDGQLLHLVADKNKVEPT